LASVRLAELRLLSGPQLLLTGDATRGNQHFYHENQWLDHQRPLPSIYVGHSGQNPPSNKKESIQQNPLVKFEQQSRPTHAPESTTEQA